MNSNFIGCVYQFAVIFSKIFVFFFIRFPFSREREKRNIFYKSCLESRIQFFAAPASCQTGVVDSGFDSQLCLSWCLKE